MKKGIHPDNYRPVVFKDMSNEDVFITQALLTRSIQVRPNWSILPDVLISS